MSQSKFQKYPEGKRIVEDEPWRVGAGEGKKKNKTKPDEIGKQGAKKILFN